MCTLSWWCAQDCYGVFFNRDESVRRSAALPPELREQGSLTYLSPLDPDGGGTWIFVNGAGLIGCLLNNYQAPFNAPDPISRGLLLLSLAGHRTAAAAGREVEQAEHGRYSGFHLLLYQDGNTRLYNWDGNTLTQRRGSEIQPPLISSGFRPEEVAAYRQEKFRLEVLPVDGSYPDRMQEFHNFHDHHLPAYSPLMVRSAARTVSQSRVTVEPRRISFSYRAVEPDRQFQPAILTTLNRDS